MVGTVAIYFLAIALQRAPQFMHQPRFELKGMVVQCAKRLTDHTLKIIHILWQCDAMASAIVDQREHFGGDLPQIKTRKPSTVSQRAVNPSQAPAGGHDRKRQHDTFRPQRQRRNVREQQGCTTSRMAQRSLQRRDDK